MVTSGTMAKAFSRAFALARLATTSGSRRSPRNAFSIESAMRAARRASSVVELELARHRDGVERAPVGGGEDLRIDDVGAGDRAGAGDDGQQPGMIRRHHGELGHAARGRERDRGGERLSGLRGRTQEARMRDLLRQIDLEPIGRVMQRDIGVDLGRRPILELGPELGLGNGDALGAVDLGESAGEHRLGLVIERANELRLPAVPHARSDRLDVGGGEDGKQLHALDRLHDRG